MNFEEAFSMVELYNKVNILFEERKILFEIYKSHCQTNGLNVPKNVDELLRYWEANVLKENSQNLKNDIN